MKLDRNREIRVKHIQKNLMEAAANADAVIESVAKYGHHRLLQAIEIDQGYRTAVVLLFREGQWQVAVIQYLNGTKKQWEEKILMTMHEAMEGRCKVETIVDHYAHIHEHPEELLFDKDFQYW